MLIHLDGWEIRTGFLAQTQLFGRVNQKMADLYLSLPPTPYSTFQIHQSFKKEKPSYKFGKHSTCSYHHRSFNVWLQPHPLVIQLTAFVLLPFCRENNLRVDKTARLFPGRRLETVPEEDLLGGGTKRFPSVSATRERAAALRAPSLPAQAPRSRGIHFFFVKYLPRFILGSRLFKAAEPEH